MPPRQQEHASFGLKIRLKVFSADNNDISYTFSNEERRTGQYATRAPARFRCSALHLFRYRSSDKVSLYVAVLFSSQAVYAFLAIPHWLYKRPPKYIVFSYVDVCIRTFCYIQAQYKDVTQFLSNIVFPDPTV